MRNKEYDEELAIRIITDYLKEEKNIHIKNTRHLTQKEEDPPDFYFEIGDRKIGCEVTHFDLKEKDNLARESAIIRDIMERADRSLQEKGIPRLVLSISFITSPTEVRKKCRKYSKCNHNNAQRINHRQPRIQTERLQQILRIIHRTRHRLHKLFLQRPSPGKYR